MRELRATYNLLALEQAAALAGFVRRLLIVKFAVG